MMKLAKDALDLGIIVSDISASLEFYQETLGMEKVEDLKVPFGVLHRLRYSRVGKGVQGGSKHKIEEDLSKCAKDHISEMGYKKLVDGGL